MTRRLAPPAIALCLLAAGAAPAYAAPELIEGSVAPPPGAFASSAVTGTATVFLDESAFRKRGTFRTVGFATVRNGDFKVTTPATPMLRRVAARNAGNVNLLLLVKTAAGKAVLPFTRKLSAGRWLARSSTSPRLPLHPWGNGTTSTRALASQERSDCEWRRSKNYYRYTRVGQLHQWGGFRSTFYYASGSQADSEIGAAVAYGRAGFEARGETSVTKTTVSERGSIIRPPGPGAFSRYVQTRFAYYYLYLHGNDCNRGPGDLTRVLRTQPPRGRVVLQEVRRRRQRARRQLPHGGQRPQAHHRPQEHRMGFQRHGEERLARHQHLRHHAGQPERLVDAREDRMGERRHGATAICSVFGEPNTAPVTYVGGVIRN